MVRALDAVPFDSDRRYMATLHRDPTGRVVAYVKGAVERILGMAVDELGPDGRTIPLDTAAVHARIDELVVLVGSRRALGQAVRATGSGRRHTASPTASTCRRDVRRPRP